MSITAAIIGSSTGIGCALANLLRENAVETVLFTRFPEALEGFHSYSLDLTRETEAHELLSRALSEHPSIETVYLVSGTGDGEKTPDIETAKTTISLNCTGFTIAAYRAMDHFETQGGGQLIAVTSVSAIRGGSESLSYNASKAYQSSLLEGLRCRAAKRGTSITVTEIRAGFVDTSMMKAENSFWIATPRQAAEAIFAASRSKKEMVYVLARWRFLAWILSLLPRFLYKRIG